MDVYGLGVWVLTFKKFSKVFIHVRRENSYIYRISLLNADA